MLSFSSVIKDFNVKPLIKNLNLGLYSCDKDDTSISQTLSTTNNEWHWPKGFVTRPQSSFEIVYV